MAEANSSENTNSPGKSTNSNSVTPIRLKVGKSMNSWKQEDKQLILNEYDRMARELERLKSDSQTEDVLNKSYKLDTNTPCYHGRRDENAEKWIMIINNNLRAAGVPENRKLYAITNYVKDSALSMLIKYQQDVSAENRKIDDFFEILLEKENCSNCEKRFYKIEINEFKAR